MPRFFVDTVISAHISLVLPEGVARHLHVLRLKQDDTLTLFDGSGAAFEATLVEINKKHAVAQVGVMLASNGAEPPYQVTLVQGIASNEKMDWLIEKAVELGVDRIVPVTAERSVVRLQGERRLRRATHWTALSQAACEQCQRNRVPKIAPAQSFDDWLEAVRGDDTLKLMLSPRGTLSFNDLPVAPPPMPVTLAIGPEGGWSSSEENALLAAQFQPLSLGPRILRTETAGMAVLAALAARWGGWQ